VQERLGHATVAMTLDCYSHWIAWMGEQTAVAMDTSLGLSQLLSKRCQNRATRRYPVEFMLQIVRFYSDRKRGTDYMI
jgi:hypothetical protein